VRIPTTREEVTAAEQAVLAVAQWVSRVCESEANVVIRVSTTPGHAPWIAWACSVPDGYSCEVADPIQLLTSMAETTAQTTLVYLRTEQQVELLKRLRAAISAKESLT